MKKWMRHVLLAIAILSIFRLGLISFSRLNLNWDLLYESPNVNTAILMDRGIDVYSKDVYDAPPFNLNLYTPAFFKTVTSVPGFREAPFRTGRALSMSFAAAAFLILVWVFYRENMFIPAVIGVGWLSMFMPYVVNVSFFRMDLMAMFFSVASIAVLFRRELSAGSVAGAAALAAVSLLTKQSGIAAPVAAMIYLVWKSPRHAAGYALVILLILVPVFSILNRSSAGGFLWCVLEAPRNPFRAQTFIRNWLEMDSNLFYALLILSAIACLRLFRSADVSPERMWPNRLIGLYFLTSWVWATLAIGKLGASTNYFLEPLYVSVWAILTWISGRSGGTASWKEAAVWGLILFSWAWPLRLMNFSDPLVSRNWNMAGTYATMRREVSGMTGVSQPKVFNLATHQASLSSGLDLYLNDPFLYAILWNTNVLSNRSILKAIDGNFFDVVALPYGTRAQRIADPVPLGEIYNKIFEKYEFASDGVFAYYLPIPSTSPVK